MRYIREATDLVGKTVLLRVDFNVETVKDALKLRESLETILFLKKAGAKVVLMSHRGRPTGIEPELSLKFALPFLRREVSAGITFFSFHEKRRGHHVEGWDFDEAWHTIQAGENGSVFLMENLRFHSGEDSQDKKLAHSFASLGDIYVNDAFASWRPGMSVTVLPKLLPAYAGFLLERELTHLNKVLVRPKKPLVVIMAGGGKAIDKFDVIKHLHKKATTFLIGGVLANTFLKAKGLDVDDSVVEDSLLDDVKNYLNDPKMEVPSDWISDTHGKILDLGELSAKRYQAVIKKAGTIIWNGPMGIFEDKRYRAGSRAIAEAVAKSKAFSVAGGGETTELILQLKLEKEFGFLSTGGGAMLAYLAGKKMPALEALSNE